MATETKKQNYRTEGYGEDENTWEPAKNIEEGSGGFSRMLVENGEEQDGRMEQNGWMEQN